MDIEEFKLKLIKCLNEIDINASEEEVKKLYKYMNTLIEWNKVMNLTAIVEPNEIIIKHFEDSLTINKYVNANDEVIDVGTGAGFPGIPIAIFNEKANITLLDSLNKRINFLAEVTKNTGINNCSLVHSRAEDAGRLEKYREKYDIATSIAVAPLNVLLEYLLPFAKVGGLCICMKGPKTDEEVKQSENALKQLGGKVEKIEKIILQGENIERNIVVIRKIKQTSKEYPRKAGLPSKKPL